MKAKRTILLAGTVFLLAVFLVGCQPTRRVVVIPPPAGPPPAPPGLQRAAINHIRNGKNQLAKGHCRQAIHQFNQAIEKDYYNPYGHYWMGVALHNCSYYPAAIEEWYAVIRLAPGNQVWESQVRTAIGFSLETQGRFAQAHQEYDLALRLNPGNLVARMGFDDTRAYAEAPGPPVRRGQGRGEPLPVPHFGEKMDLIMRGVED